MSTEYVAKFGDVKASLDQLSFTDQHNERITSTEKDPDVAILGTSLMVHVLEAKTRETTLARVQTEAFDDLFDREDFSVNDLLETLSNFEERDKIMKYAGRALAINMLVRRYMTCPAAAKKTKKEFDKHMATTLSVVHNLMKIDLRSLPKELTARLLYRRAEGD